MNEEAQVTTCAQQAAKWIIFGLQQAQEHLGHLKGCSGCDISWERDFPTSNCSVLFGAVPVVLEESRPGADARPGSLTS